MPTFFNANRHRVYVQKPGHGLVRVRAGGEVEADGEFADNVESTSGLVNLGTKEGKEARKRYEANEERLAAPGPKAFPDPDAAAEQEEVVEGDAPKRGSAKKSGGTVTTEKAPTK